MNRHRSPPPTSMKRLLPLLAAMALLFHPCPTQAQQGRRLAVVIAVGNYPSVNPETDLRDTRQDAKELANLLEDRLGFQEVHLLLDGLATRNTIEDLLFETLPGTLGPDDTLLVYFAGLGIGGDFDQPYLLTYDSDPSRLQESALGVADFAAHLPQLEKIGSIVLITDTSHPGQVHGLPFIGPDARSWPMLCGNFLAISSTTAQEIRPEADFTRSLTLALGGAADLNGDRSISASELHGYLLQESMRISDDRVHVAKAGNHDPAMILADLGKPEPGPAAPGRHPGRARRLMGLSMLGTGATLGALRVGYWVREEQMYSCAYESADPPTGYSVEDCRAEHQRLYESPLHQVLLWGAVGFGLAGGTFLVIPTGGGTRVAWQARF